MVSAIQAKAVIFGCEGPVLSEWERSFFREQQPYGFILFKRNCVDPPQLRRLTADLRGTSTRDDLPILIDQEGGRVIRMAAPHWREPPAPALFGRLAQNHPQEALEAVRLNSQLIAWEILSHGINVNCLPLLDLPIEGASDVIGDRAFSPSLECTVTLAREQCAAFLEAGVMPVIKHIPGHGRALVDSHHSLPRVENNAEELSATDFAPFRALGDMPWAMTAHVVYTAFDEEQPATTSSKVIETVIRGEMGFLGLLLSDDLSMQALAGTLAERASSALAAGCDIALHCNGRAEEMEMVAAASQALSGSSLERAEEAWQRLARPIRSFEEKAALDRLAQHLALV